MTTDALTSYRKMPLAVALPRTTQEVSDVMRFCHENGVKVVARGAGTSLAGGAIPQEDAVVIGVAKLTDVIEMNFADPLRAGSIGHHQSRHQWRGGA